jgi:hypothetical protein
MPQNSQRQQQAAGEIDVSISVGVNKGRLDLMILRHMAYRVSLALKDIEDMTSVLPLLSYSDERHNRMHRIAIYDPLALKTPGDLAFVGFVSKKQQPLAVSIVEDIHEVDRKLIAELIGTPGMLSYSSLELCTGRWYNLVLLRDATTKEHIKNSETHKYAAYQLAPRYYEWIRLHNGVIPKGLAYSDLILRKTKLYTFQRLTPHTSVREHSHESTTLQDTAIHSTIQQRQVSMQLVVTSNTLVVRSLG